MIQEVVQNILVYVIVMAVLKGLVSHPGFLEIFRFVSGLILVLLFAIPILSVLSEGNRWYERLEENIFHVDRQQLQQELQVADGSFEDILVEECEEEMERQLAEIASEERQEVERVHVKIEYSGGEAEVKSVEMIIGDGAKQASAQAVDEVTPVEQIVIGGGAEREDRKKVRRSDSQTRAIQKKICQRYGLPKEVVAVWKKSGKDSLTH